MRTTAPFALLLALTLAGCPTTEEAACPGAVDLASGTVQATVDGAAWESVVGAYLWGGPSLQVTTDRVDGWQLSIVAQRDAAETTVQDLVDAGSLPVTITLGSSLDGGWALIHADDGGPYETEGAAGGSITFQEFLDGDVLGCFHCEASDGNATVVFEDGLLRVPESS